MTMSNGFSCISVSNSGQFHGCEKEIRNLGDPCTRSLGWPLNYAAQRPLVPQALGVWSVDSPYPSCKSCLVQGHICPGKSPSNDRLSTKSVQSNKALIILIRSRMDPKVPTGFGNGFVRLVSQFSFSCPVLVSHSLSYKLSSLNYIPPTILSYHLIPENET